MHRSHNDFEFADPDLVHCPYVLEKRCTAETETANRLKMIVLSIENIDVGLATVTRTKPVIRLPSPYLSWYGGGGTVFDVLIVEDRP
jgi:hypothetical protein